MTSWPTVNLAASGTLLPFSEQVEAKARVDFAAAIKKYAIADINPDDVHIFGMRFTSSTTNAWWGRVPPDAITEMCARVPGRPLMIGHDKSQAPIGKFFAAERVYRPVSPRAPKSESYHGEGLFMLPRTPIGDHQAALIKTGIWSESSTGWQALDMLCSICGNDLRGEKCLHLPGEVYLDGGLADFETVNIPHVGEISVVYGGAVRGTHMKMAASADGSFDASAALAAGAVPEFLAMRAEKILNAIGGNTVDDWMADLLEAAATGPGYPMPQRANVAEVICSSDRFDSAQEAAAWCAQHDFRSGKMSETSEGWSFEQQKGAGRSTRTIRLRDGVQAVVKVAKTPSEKNDHSAALAGLLAQQ